MTTPDPYGTLLVQFPQDERACSQALSHARRRSIETLVASKSHLYLGISHPRILPDGMEVLAGWGFIHKTLFVQIQPDLASDEHPFDGYFSLATTPFLFGVRGRLRTFAPGRRQVNVIRTTTQQISSTPLYEIIETCSPGPFLAISESTLDRPNWTHWSWDHFLHQPWN